MPQSVVRRATIADCADIAAIYLSAFQDDPIISTLHRKLSPQIQLEYQTKRYQRAFVMAAFGGAHYFKAVDKSTG